MFPAEPRFLRPDPSLLGVFHTSVNAHKDGADRRPSEEGVECAAGRTHLEHHELAELRRKLETLPTIEQAKGMLMGYYGVNAEVAFKVLRRWSMRSNIKLNVICAELVAAASQPAPEPFGGFRAGIARIGSGPTPTE